MEVYGFLTGALVDDILSSACSAFGALRHPWLRAPADAR